jgi:AraC family transcriptional regulator
LRIRDALHDSPVTPPSTRDLAREANLHPVYVARAFRRWFGCGLADYARRQRLGYAYRRLIDSTAPLSRVAIESGFADQSHLHRELRRRLGRTPGNVRREEVSRVQEKFHSAP